MGIKSITTHVLPGNHVALVRVEADDGVVGWGQAAPYHADITATVLHRQVAWYALQHPAGTPADLAAISERVILANHKFPWSYVCRALSGVDLALWDILGKRQGKPVAELMGGRLRPMRAYASSQRRDIDASDEADRLLRLRDIHGFDAFKVRVGQVCGKDTDASPGRTERIIRACREALGSDATLMADANSGYSPAQAIRVGRLLEDAGYAHFEEPCPYWELEQTAEVAAALDIPVAGGEQDNDLAQFRRMLRMNAVDIVQPDVCYVGGLSRCLTVVKDAATLGKPVLPHAANRSLILVATMHLMCSINNPGAYVEYNIDPTPGIDDVNQPAVEVRDGLAHAPHGPGWGLSDPPQALLDRCVTQVSARSS